MRQIISFEFAVLLLIAACGPGVSTRPVPTTSEESNQRSFVHLNPSLDLALGMIAEVDHSAFLTDCGIIHLYLYKDAVGIIIDMTFEDISFGDCPDLSKRLNEMIAELRDEKRLNPRDPVVEFILDSGTLIPVTEIELNQQRQELPPGVFLFQP